MYEADPLVCPRCAGPMRIVAFITGPMVIRKILLHLAAKGTGSQPAWRVCCGTCAPRNTDIPGVVRPPP